jgi:glucose/arabinose dehydrogenase
VQKWPFRGDHTQPTLGGIRCLALIACVFAASAGAAHAYSFQQVASGFADPTDVTTAPGDPSTLYVVEQRGTVQMVRDGKLAGTFLDLSDRVLAENERGLLSIAFDPGYARTHLFYVDYTDLRGDSHVVERNSVTGAERELLFVAQPYPNHNGGQLAFDRRGFLYVGMGDGGTNAATGALLGDPENRAQNLSSKLGKLLRIVPSRAGATWQMVGLGLRNPWRFTFDRTTGDLWLGDVGAGGYEEVDHRPAAKLGVLANYGWSRFEGATFYNRKIRLARGVLVPPVWAYNHANGSCSVVGGYVYRGQAIPSARGRYFFGDFCSGVVWSFKVGAKGRASAVTRMSGTVPNLSSFGEDANGELYAVGLDGVLYALRP